MVLLTSLPRILVRFVLTYIMIGFSKVNVLALETPCENKRVLVKDELNRFKY